MLKWLADRFERQRSTLQSRLEDRLQTAPSAAVLMDCSAWLKRGNDRLDAGDLAQAEENYQKALDLAPANVSALVNLGFVKSQRSKPNEARSLLQHALTLDVKNADAWYMLGGINERGKDLPHAADALQRAIALRPDFELAYRDLCRVLFQSGDLSAAKRTILRARELNPASADFHFYLGNVHFFEGDNAAATACFEQTLRIEPQFAQAHANLGKVLEKQSQLDAALIRYQQALQLQPANAGFHSDIGGIYLLRGQPTQAQAFYRHALSLEPLQAEAHMHLGSALLAGGNPVGAAASCQTAIRLNPEVAMAHNIEGIALQELGQPEPALAAFGRALAPGLVVALCNIGSVHLSQGRLDDAIEQYREALRVGPANEAGNSNLLFALNYHPDLGATEIFAAYRRFDASIGLPLRATWKPHQNSRVADRRLRIGYVSPDFRKHSVMWFLEPVLAHHDVGAFEIFAYSGVVREDDTTGRARNLVAQWRSTVGQSDEAVAEMVRADRIDILVDLTGHTGNNRLAVFARKPAPVSVSRLGCGYTTGLSAINYYLTDAVAAPPGCDALFSETPWRMYRTAFVYRADPEMGDEGTLPAAGRGYVTFGTLTRPVRINHRVVRVWAEILRRVSHSRLVVDSKSYADASTRDALIARFGSMGIASDRLQIGYHSPPWDLLRGVDISLDCFPHNSGTTLFESLHMGVPYVTLAERPRVGCLGASILQGLGKPGWIARSEEQYVQLAVTLAGDLDGLALLRRDLRSQMKESCLMDEAGFTRDLEQAYRSMFDAWENRKTEHFPS